MVPIGSVPDLCILFTFGVFYFMLFCVSFMSYVCIAEFVLLLHVSKANKSPRLEKKELIFLPSTNRTSVLYVIEKQ